jgi:hypothetical protein
METPTNLTSSVGHMLVFCTALAELLEQGEGFNQRLCAEGIRAYVDRNDLRRLIKDPAWAAALGQWRDELALALRENAAELGDLARGRSPGAVIPGV